MPDVIDLGFVAPPLTTFVTEFDLSLDRCAVPPATHSLHQLAARIRHQRARLAVADQFTVNGLRALFFDCPSEEVGGARFQGMLLDRLFLLLGEELREIFLPRARVAVAAASQSFDLFRRLAVEQSAADLDRWAVLSRDAFTGVMGDQVPRARAEAVTEVKTLLARFNEMLRAYCQRLSLEALDCCALVSWLLAGKKEATWTHDEGLSSDRHTERLLAYLLIRYDGTK